jgi:hypothetical protein
MTRRNPLSTLPLWASGMPDSGLAEVSTLSALTGAAAAMARLDKALASHPLQQALLYRLRLEAVRRQAAVDGSLIDPWNLGNARGAAAEHGSLSAHDRPWSHPRCGPCGPHASSVDRRT